MNLEFEGEYINPLSLPDVAHTQRYIIILSGGVDYVKRVQRVNGKRNGIGKDIPDMVY